MKPEGKLPSTVHRLSLLVRWSLISCLLLLILGVTTELIIYPAVVATAGVQGLVYLILFVPAMLIYSWLIFFRTCVATRAQWIALRAGAFWGLLCGTAWVIELLVANVLSLQWEWFHLVLYYGSTWIAYLLPGLAGLLTGWHARRIMAGLRAGLLCGMFGGLAISLFYRRSFSLPGSMTHRLSLSSSEVVCLTSRPT